MAPGHIGFKKRLLEQQETNPLPPSKRAKQQEPALGKLSLLPEDLLLGRILPDALVDDAFRHSFPQVCKSAASALFTVAQRITTANMQHVFTHAQGATVLRSSGTSKAPMPHTPLQANSAQKFLRDLDVKAWHHAVENLVRAGQFTQAQNQLDSAIEAYPESYRLRFRQAEIYELQGDFANAKNSYNLIDKGCFDSAEASRRCRAIETLFAFAEACRQGDWSTALSEGRKVLLWSDRCPAAQDVIDRAFAQIPARPSEEGMQMTREIRLKSLKITQALARARKILEDANDIIARNGEQSFPAVHRMLNLQKIICAQICLERDNEFEAEALGEEISKVLTKQGSGWLPSGAPPA